jgi:hypothetical protein
MNPQASNAPLAWPELPYAAWRDSYATLHLWTQVVGKIRLAQTPWLNHSWQVALYVTARGLTTSPMPHGTGVFEIAFDFVDHVLRIDTSRGPARQIRLEPKTVADFHAEVMSALDALGVPVRIDDLPCELVDPLRFSEDRVHGAYDRAAVQRFAGVLLQADRLLKQFRTGFLGKASPVHFFWGSFDLATTRFSGRRAPLHPGGVPHLPSSVAREAYSHEVSSAGFWPGNDKVDAAFYAYAYPEPPGFRTHKVQPQAAHFDTTLSEFLLPYESVRNAADPERAVLDFLQSSYEAAADAAKWDRAELECDLGKPGVPRPVG